ncbi:MAG: hypothetical protein ACP5T9_03655 [Thermoplasmata archaeon]
MADYSDDQPEPLQEMLELTVYLTDPRRVELLPAIYAYFVKLSGHLSKSDIRIEDRPDRAGIWLGDLYFSVGELDGFDIMVDYYNRSVFIHLIGVKMIYHGFTLLFSFEIPGDSVEL